MPRLAKLVDQRTSQDIITGGPKISLDCDVEPEQANGPVKTTLDLSQFIKFDGQKTQGRKGKWMSVNVRGDINISHEIGLSLKLDTADFYLNRKGTILVMKESLNGIPLRTYKKTCSRHATCKAIKDMLVKLGVKLPVRFIAEWDDELKAWVGRREA